MRSLLPETRQKEAEEASGAGQVRLRPRAHGGGGPSRQWRILSNGNNLYVLHYFSKSQSFVIGKSSEIIILGELNPRIG